MCAKQSEKIYSKTLSQMLKKIASKEPGDYVMTCPSPDPNNNYSFRVRKTEDGNISFEGFSLSSEEAVRQMARYVKDNEVNNAFVVATESSLATPINFEPEERRALIDNNVTVINPYIYDSRSLLTRVTNYEGVHIIDVKIKLIGADGHDYSSDLPKNGDRHLIADMILRDSGIDNIASGEFDFNNLPSSYTVNHPTYNKYSFNGDTYTVEYELVEHYVDANGVYRTRSITPDQANMIVKNGGTIPDVSQFTTADKFDLTEHDSLLLGVYSGLKDLDKLTLKSDGTISSDYTGVETAMGEVTSAISSSDFLSSLKSIDFRSSSGIPGCIGTTVNTFFTAVGSLLEKLNMQSAVAVSVAQAYVDMDADLAGNGEITELAEETPQLPPNAHPCADFLHKSVYDKAYLTADEINEMIEIELQNMKKNGKNTDISVLRGTGEYFVQAAKETGLDPLFLISLAQHESTLGASSYAVKYNNFFGMRYQNGVQYFGINKRTGRSEDKPYAATPGEGIMKGAKWIDEFYMKYYSKGVQKSSTDDTVAFANTGYGGKGSGKRLSGELAVMMKGIKDRYEAATGKKILFVSDDYNIPTQTPPTQTTPPQTPPTQTTPPQTPPTQTTPPQTPPTQTTPPQTPPTQTPPTQTPPTQTPPTQTPPTQTPPTQTPPTQTPPEEPTTPEEPVETPPMDETPYDEPVETTPMEETPYEELETPTYYEEPEPVSYVSEEPTYEAETYEPSVDYGESEYVEPSYVEPEDYSEPIVEPTPTPIPEEDIPDDNVTPTPSSNTTRDGSGAKAAATILATGAAIGAAGYGAYKYMEKAKENRERGDDDDEDEDNKPKDTNEFGV